MTVLYALTKLLEHHDHKVYAFSGIQGGHRLKHLAAAAACFAILEAVPSSPTAGVKVGPQSMSGTRVFRWDYCSSHALDGAMCCPFGPISLRPTLLFAWPPDQMMRSCSETDSSGSN